MRLPQVPLKLALLALFLLVVSCTLTAVLTVRTYRDHKRGGKKPPHIELHVLKNGIVLINDEFRTFRNVGVTLDAPLGGWGGYEYTFAKIEGHSGISAGYVQFVRKDNGTLFPTNRTPKKIGLLMQGYRGATWREDVEGLATRNLRNKTISEFANEMVAKGEAHDLKW
jgi:hypothetical protein